MQVLKALATWLCVWKWQFSIDSWTEKDFLAGMIFHVLQHPLCQRAKPSVSNFLLKKKKKVNDLCVLLPDSSFKSKAVYPCAPRWQSTGSHVTAMLLFPNSALQQCVGEKRLSYKIFICFCNFCTPFNYKAPLVCWNKVNDSIIIISA